MFPNKRVVQKGPPALGSAGTHPQRPQQDRTSTEGESGNRHGGGERGGREGSPLRGSRGVSFFPWDTLVLSSSPASSSSALCFLSLLPAFYTDPSLVSPDARCRECDRVSVQGLGCVGPDVWSTRTLSFILNMKRYQAFLAGLLGFL